MKSMKTIKTMKSIEIYTDGSYKKIKNKVFCGYGIYFPNSEYKSIGRKFTHEPITNNRAELYAILKSLLIVNIINLKSSSVDKITQANIYSDSEYSVKSINIWHKQWLKSKKPYLNADIIDQIIEFIANADFNVNLQHINSHTNDTTEQSISNDRADQLAKLGAKR